MSKSATKLKFSPWKHDGVGVFEPLVRINTLPGSTCETDTSLAVQTNELELGVFGQFVSLTLLNWLYSSCKQVPWPNAGTATMAIASSARMNKNVLQQFVRQLIFPP